MEDSQIGLHVFIHSVYLLFGFHFNSFFLFFQEAEEFERSWLLLADIYIQVCYNVKLITIMKFIISLSKYARCDR